MISTLRKTLLTAVVVAVGGMPAAAQAQDCVGEDRLVSVQFDKLEYVRAQGHESASYDGQARLGSVENQAVLKVEGEVANGGLQESKTQLLWKHEASASWDTLLGIRFDHGRASAHREWLVLTAEGTVLDWLDVELTAYAGSAGRTAFELSVDRDIRLAQQLYLRPKIELHFYGKNDEKWGNGSGLSEGTAELRLMYKVTPYWAPYIGVEWQRKFGKTADYARQNGDPRDQTRFVAGMSLRF